MGWRLVGRRSRIQGTKISEMVETPNGVRRRYVATIRGWANWRILETETMDTNRRIKTVNDRVESIRERIDDGDEAIFARHEKDPLKYCEICHAKYIYEVEPFIYRGGGKPIFVCRDCLCGKRVN